MIANDFEYYKPDSANEAVQTFMGLEHAGKAPAYYGGGTEIITMSRAGTACYGAVVDIKAIPECRELGYRGDNLVIGSGMTLSDIFESGEFPALGAAGARVADHSVQGKITLGGNIAGTIMYREAALPLILCDAVVTVAGPDGQREVPLCDVLANGRLSLQTGELLVSVAVERRAVQSPWFHVKKTKMEEIGYPLLTLVAIRIDGRLKLAVSGMYANPVRLDALERDLARPGISRGDRAADAVSRLPAGILSNLDGSADYRRFILGRVLADCLSEMEAS